MPRLKYFLVFIFCFPAFVTITAAQRPPLKAVTSTAGRIFVIQQRFDLTEERLKTKPQATKREIVIAAVVFEDGSFEGEPDGAAEMAAAMRGNSIQLTRVIPLLRKLVARTGGGSDQLKMFQKDIAALPGHVDSGVVEELSQRPPKI